MKPLAGYWLDPVAHESKATPDLGFELVGGPASARRSSAKRRCVRCRGRLGLVAIYRRSSYIPLERYAAILLEICPACAKESDGTAGANGYTARFVGSTALRTALASTPRHLPETIRFVATPTGEPRSEAAFRRWKGLRVKPKLGGRQIAIQGELRRKRCRRCGGPWRFVGSIAERWARWQLNFGFGYGYVFACGRECSSRSALFYWDC